MGFSESVKKALNYYVYRLIDPRNGETFYVGKGKGDRVFAHAADELKKEDYGEDEDELSAKLARIRAIRTAGLNVITIIHRHGMTEETAIEVEAALIDAYPGLANEQCGHGSRDRGPMHTTEIITHYEAEEADLSNFTSSLIIKIRQGTIDDCNGDVYEAVRSAWKVRRTLLGNNTVPYVFAVVNGIIRGVYNVDEWYIASPDRLGFNGTEAVELRHFIGQSIPQTYCEPGSANPVRYIG